MPSPVGHSLLGVVITGAFYIPRGSVSHWIKTLREKKHYFLFGILFANLPDIDYLPGVLMGDLNHYHHMYTHTLGWVMMVTLGAWFVWKVRQPQIAWKEGLFLFTLLASHLVSDWLTADGKPPYGLMLFWPLSDHYFISSTPIFWRLFKNNWSECWQLHNLLAAAVESAWCSAFMAVLAFSKFRRD